MARQLSTKPRGRERVDLPAGAAGATERSARRGQIKIISLAGLTAPGLPEGRGAQASVRRDATFRFGLGVADSSALMVALVLTASVSRGAHLQWYAVGAIPILWLAAKIIGLYDRDELLLRKTTLDEVPTVFQLATLCTMLCWLAHRMVYAGLFTARDALVLWLLLTLMLALGRTLARALALRLSGTERCLFIGDQRTATAVGDKLAQGGGVRATLIGCVQLAEAAPWSSSTFSIQRLSEIRSLAKDMNLHRVIIAPTNDDSAEMHDLIRTFDAIGVRVTVVPRVLEVAGTAVEFDDLHGLTVMGMRRFKVSGSAGALKRAFDLVGTLAMLLVLSPVLLAVAGAIRLDSRGPIFFRQTRVGRGGKPFQMLKFRTMVPDAERLKAELIERNEAKEGFFKIRDDPRVTGVGRFLRQSSLDELPQLFNVLRGEMSLVGPRPLIPREDESVKGWHRRRLELTPGMTGHWQLHGSTRIPLREMAAMDFLYAANWSLWTDIKVLLRTAVHILAGRGH
ncbi:MAG: sugar transferase [Actinomycetota bacterium]|nr:sugar transferase [Actinomycetota bacterium]